MSDWPAYLDAVRDICDQDDETFGYSAALQADKGELDTFKINVRHVCPDRVDDIDKASEAISEVERACENPDESESARRMAEAVGCL